MFSLLNNPFGESEVSLHRGTPNHPKLDHDLVLKPMVLGDPPF